MTKWPSSRYGLIADLTHMEPGAPGTYARLQEKASHSYAIPGSRRTRVAAETMRGWLRDWGAKGTSSLCAPSAAPNEGQARAIQQEVADLLCSIKEETPAFSVTLG